MWLAVSNVPFWGMDVLAAAPPLPWETLATRIVWMLLTLLSVLGVRYLPPRHQSAVSWFLVELVVPHFCMGLLAIQLGGSQSPIFAWLCVAPLLSVSLSPGVMHRSVVSAAAGLATVIVLLLMEGRPASYVAVWGLLVFATGIVAVQISNFYARLKKAREHAEAHQQETHEALVAVKTQAQEADRLAQVGRPRVDESSWLRRLTLLRSAALTP